jgi:hypothetical protein
MAVLTYLRCPHCGESYGSIQRTIRKESAPLAVKCRRCNKYINLTNLALEWELLSDEQKIIRYLSTGLVATVTGAGYSLLIAIGLFLLPYIFGYSAPNSSIPIGKPIFLIPFTLIAIVLVVWQYYRMIKADIEGSARRLADPEYRQVLRALGKTLPAKYDEDF